MKRWLPYPVFSLALLAMWLLLNESLALQHALLGAALALAYAAEPPGFSRCLWKSAIPARSQRSRAS